MNLRLASVLAITILMLITVTGCCCPIPSSLGDKTSTKAPSTPSKSSEPAATTNPTEFTWGTDLNAGLEKAKADGKPVLLDFWGGG